MVEAFSRVTNAIAAVHDEAAAFLRLVSDTRQSRQGRAFRWMLPPPIWMHNRYWLVKPFTEIWVT